MEPRPDSERVVLDSSVLLGGQRSSLVAAAALRYYLGFWSPWIVSEFVRKRTEWIAERAVRDGCNRSETRRRLRESRRRINVLIDEMSHNFLSVEYTEAVPKTIPWVPDPDDWPVVQTTRAAGATVLVTDNSRDFPLGDSRDGILFVGSHAFLRRLFNQYPDAEATIREYLIASSSNS